jgi:membrane-associated phospholipid phosphatase
MKNMFCMKKIILLFATFCIVISTNIKAQNIDLDLLKKINPNNQNSDVWKGVTNSVYPIAAAAPTAILAYRFLKKDKKVWRIAWYFGASYASSFIVTQGSKYLIDRARPYVVDTTLLSFSKESDPSFPSGHTSMAFATAASLSYTFKKWYITVPAYLWAGSVAYSRLYTHNHYPSDVLVGALVGTASSWLSYKLSKKLFGR